MDTSFLDDANERTPGDDGPGESLLERYLAGDATDCECDDVRRWLARHPGTAVPLSAIAHAIQYPLPGSRADGFVFEDRVMAALRSERTASVSSVATGRDATQAFRIRGAWLVAGVALLALVAVVGQYPRLTTQRVPARVYSMRDDGSHQHMPVERTSPSVSHTDAASTSPAFETHVVAEPPTRASDPSAAVVSVGTGSAVASASRGSEHHESPSANAASLEDPMVFEGEILFDPSPFGRGSHIHSGCSCPRSFSMEPAAALAGPSIL